MFPWWVTSPSGISRSSPDLRIPVLDSHEGFATQFWVVERSFTQVPEIEASLNSTAMFYLGRVSDGRTWSFPKRILPRARLPVRSKRIQLSLNIFILFDQDT
jgi:hypothetical protein